LEVFGVLLGLVEGDEDFAEGEAEFLEGYVHAVGPWVSWSFSSGGCGGLDTGRI
jgi:hypothetical protein